MSENILESYLVSLNFRTEDSSLHKFNGALNQAERAAKLTAGALTRDISGVEKSLGCSFVGMTRKVLEVQGALTSGFLGISGAILGVLDKAAMADQSYRLMGLRMMMTGESARKLSMITSALGASLEEIIWDPELHQRANEMSAHIDRMTGMLGLSFEKDMRSIRDVRAEFGRLGVDVEFLGLKFATDLWQKVSPGDPAKQLDQWIGDFEKKIPELSGDLSTLGSLILKDTVHVLQETGAAAKEGALAFTNFVGALSNDKSIESSTFSFHNLAKALEHVEHAAFGVLGAVTGAEKTVGDVANAAALYLGGKPEEASDKFKKARKDLTAGSGAVLGLAPGAAVGGAAGAILGLPAGPLGVAVGGALGTAAGAALGAGGGALVGKATQETGSTPTDAQAFMAEVKEFGGVGQALMHEVGKTIDQFYGWLYQTPAQPQTAQPAPHALNQDTRASMPPGLMMNVPVPVGALNQTQPPALRTTSDLVDQLAEAIAAVEAGSKKNPRSVRNNNPGNLRTWGDYPVDEGYVKFPDWATGMAALKHQIEKNIARGLTLGEFFAGKEGVYGGFAPKGDNNDPAAYLDTIVRKLGLGKIDLNTPLNQIVTTAPAAAAPPLIPQAPIGPPAVRPISYLMHPQPDSRSLWMSPNDGNAPRARFAGFEIPDNTLNAWPTLAGDFSDTMGVFQRNMAASMVPSAPVINAPQSIDLGGVQIYITEPGADAEQIERAVSKGIREAMAHQTQFDITQLRSSY